MNTDTHGFKHKEVTDKIIKAFYEVYNELGHGFLESVYERSLEIALNSMGLKVCRQIQIPVWLRATEIEVGLLLNFGLKPEFKRLIFDNPRKAIRGNPRISITDLLIAGNENDDSTPPS